MYINPFLAGVLATVIVEVMVCIGIVAVVTVKEMRREKRRKCKDR